MGKLTEQEMQRMSDLLLEYTRQNDEWTWTLALETIRQKIGRPIVHVRDREILQYLEQWKTKQQRMSEEPANDGTL